MTLKRDITIREPELRSALLLNAWAQRNLSLRQHGIKSLLLLHKLLSQLCEGWKNKCPLATFNTHCYKSQ